MNICFPLKAGSEASLKSPSRLCYRASHCPDILWLTDRPKAAALMCIFGAVYKFRRKIYLRRELISRHKLCHHKMFCEFLPLINSRNIFIKMQCHFLTPPSFTYLFFASAVEGPEGLSLKPESRTCERDEGEGVWDMRASAGCEAAAGRVCIVILMSASLTHAVAAVSVYNTWVFFVFFKVGMKC